MKNTDSRKINDRTMCSSTYHKKDGTAVRAIMKEQVRKDMRKMFKDGDILSK